MVLDGGTCHGRGDQVNGGAGADDKSEGWRGRTVDRVDITGATAPENLTLGRTSQKNHDGQIQRNSF